MTQRAAGGDLAARLAFAVGAVNRRLRPAGEQLTHVTLSALATIVRAGSIRPGELARIEGIAAPGVTRIIADLERQRLVGRATDPDDGRASQVTATAAGVAAIEEARSTRAARLASLLEGCSPDDLLALESAVGVLERALLRSTATPPVAAPVQTG